MREMWRGRLEIAAGKISSPWKLASIIRDEAVKRLSPRAAAPYIEFEARQNLWVARFDVQLKSDVESPAYHHELLELCDGAIDLYQRRRALPNPIDRLAAERAVLSKPELRGLIMEMLIDGGYAVPQSEQSSEWFLKRLPPAPESE